MFVAAFHAKSLSQASSQFGRIISYRRSLMSRKICPGKISDLAPGRGACRRTSIYWGAEECVYKLRYTPVLGGAILPTLLLHSFGKRKFAGHCVTSSSSRVKTSI